MPPRASMARMDREDAALRSKLDIISKPRSARYRCIRSPFVIVNDREKYSGITNAEGRSTVRKVVTRSQTAKLRLISSKYKN